MAHHRRNTRPANPLLGVDLFRDLSPDEHEILANQCHCHHYQPGKLIISHHDETRDVFFVISGQVQITLYSQSGKEVVFQDLGPGQMFGELSAIDGEPRSARVSALTGAWVTSISAEDFWNILMTHPKICAAALKHLTRLVRLLSTRIFEFYALSITDRLHSELLRLAQEHLQGNNTAVISPPPTHADLACRIGSHREAVTRELKRLKQDGLVTRADGQLIIHDIAQLTRLVEEALSD